MIAIDRRTLLASAATAFAGAWIPSALAQEVPLLKVGVVSDIHLKIGRPVDYLTAIFEGFRNRGVDVVASPGDIIDAGGLDGLERFMQVWEGVFGGLPGRNGAPDLFVAWGNHDYRCSSAQKGQNPTEEDGRLCMVFHKDEAWKRIWGEPFPGEIYMRRIKGVPFVGCHWGHEKELGPWLATHKSELSDASPFFLVQHPHPAGTVFCGTKIGERTSTKALADYPNCFSISGHSHISISDDTGLWQGMFTAMGAGCAKGPAPRHGDSTHYLNAGRDVRGTRCDVGSSWQGSVIGVYARKMVVERVDFKSGKSLGDDWKLPLPLERNPRNPFVLAERGPAPAFAADATVTARMDSTGVVVTAPQARPVGPWSRAIDDEVEVLDAENGSVVFKSLVLQDGYGMPVDLGMDRSMKCVLPLDSVSSVRRFRVRVVPRNAAGKRGNQLLSSVCERNI